jgi:hypothetical protein
MVVPQWGQREAGDMTDCPAGIRQIQTLRNEPMMVPKMKIAM